VKQELPPELEPIWSPETERYECKPTRAPIESEHAAFLPPLEMRVYVGPQTEQAARRSATTRMVECEASIESEFTPPARHAHEREDLWRFLSGAMHESAAAKRSLYWRQVRKVVTREPEQSWYQLFELYGVLRTSQALEVIDDRSRGLMQRGASVARSKRQLERLRAKLRAVEGALDPALRPAFRQARWPERQVEGIGLMPHARSQWFVRELIDGIGPGKRSGFDTPFELLMDYFDRTLGLPIQTTARVTRDVLVWFVGRAPKTCEVRNLASRYRWLKANPSKAPAQP
jgi:hypothetical protein